MKFGDSSIQVKHFFDNKYAYGILEAKVASDEMQAQKRREEEAKAAKEEVIAKQAAKQAGQQAAKQKGRPQRSPLRVRIWL